MKKVTVVITARASYSRIKSVLQALKKNKLINLEIVLKASALVDNYGSILKYLEEDNFDVNYKIYSLFNTQDISFQVKTTGIGMVELSNYLRSSNPDLVITIADRFETIATAIAASYMNIPLVHIQGGEDTGNIDNKVRNAITFLSDYHFVSNKEAKAKLVSMQVETDKIFNLGCPSIDLVNIALQGKIDNDSLYNFYSWSGEKVDLEKEYIVVMQHSVTNEGGSKAQIEMTIKAIERLKMPTIWFWPNVDSGTDGISKGLRLFNKSNPDFPITFLKSLGPQDFLKLISKSRILIGNSSVGIRESSYIGLPVVNIGSRQEKRIRARNVIDVDYDSEEIYSAIKKQLAIKNYKKSTIYGSGDSGEKIANQICRILEL
jgi:UDP-hydrolysing UDP-N-acetyl-D-glucosamine 2-epimerase